MSGENRDLPHQTSEVCPEEIIHRSRKGAKSAKMNWIWICHGGSSGSQNGARLRTPSCLTEHLSALYN
jgi:hypothetical protein